MIRSFTAATALATVFVALSPAAGAGPAPVQLAQMNAPPKIQPVPPPNLARPPVITPRIDTSRLAGERDDGQDDDDDGKDTAGNPEQIPQETATGVVPEAPAAARRTAPPIVRLTRAPLPLARPDLFGGIDPADRRPGRRRGARGGRGRGDGRRRRRALGPLRTRHPRRGR